MSTQSTFVDPTNYDLGNDVPTSRSPGMRALFLAHVVIFIAFNTTLAALNLIVSPGNVWFPYVIWGWAMVLVLHGGWTYPHRRLVRWHAGLYVVLNAGLVAINVSQGGPPWALWPMASLGVLLLAHWMIAVQGVSLFRIHLITTALCSSIILMIPLVWNTEDFIGLVIPFLELWAIVTVHWLVRFTNWSPFRIHALAYLGLMSLLAIDNALEAPGEWWALYPIALWGTLVGVHGLAIMVQLPASGRTLEATFVDDVRDRDLPNWPRRMVAYNASLFLIMAASMFAVDLVDGTDSFWSVWPIGAWLALLAIQAGSFAIPRLLFGAHLFAWIAGSIGMLAIDAGTGGGTWWYWPPCGGVSLSCYTPGWRYRRVSACWVSTPWAARR